MSTSQSPFVPPWFALPNCEVVQCAGPDALHFAQAQFSNDCGALAVGCWQWSCWLTAQGRVRALFALFRFCQDQVWLICPTGDSARLAKELQPYIIRRQLTIQPLQNWHVVAQLHPPQSAHGSHAAILADGRVEFDVGAPECQRALALVPTARDQAIGVDPILLEQWLESDLLMGFPHLTQDQLGRWTANQLSLDRLNALSVSKGCYPGQEIVARTHFLGKNKRLTTLLQTTDPVPVGASVHGWDQTPIGTVVAATARHVLAVLPVDWQQWPVLTAGAAAERRPFIAGLARPPAQSADHAARSREGEGEGDTR